MSAQKLLLEAAALRRESAAIRSQFNGDGLDHEEREGTGTQRIVRTSGSRARRYAAEILRVFFGVLVLLLLAGCCNYPGQRYVEADRATLDALVGPVTGYVLSDPALNGDQKSARLRLLRSWEQRIAQAEALTQAAEVAK